MKWRLSIAVGAIGVALGLVIWQFVSYVPFPVQRADRSLIPTGNEMPLQAFPFPLEEPILVEGLAGYEGPYLEDATNDEVCDVAALILRNTGSAVIRHIQLHLTTDAGEYRFMGSWIFPDQTCVLLEVERRIYSGEQSGDCTVEKLVWGGDTLPTGELSVEETETDTLRITNTSGRILSRVSLLYKTYLAQTDMYMGGITHELALGTLLPGQVRELTPPRYAAGYSKVLAARNENG